MKVTYPLGPCGSKTYSQYDEDGIIAELVRCVSPKKHFAEVGAHQTESNCLLLYKNSWRGVFIDGAGDGQVVKKHRVTPANVNDLLAR